MKDLIEKNVTVALDKDFNYLSVSLSGFITYEHIVKISSHIYGMIRHYKLKKCMVDLQRIEVYAPGVTEFINSKWFPEVEKLGIKHLAFVVPESSFGKASMNKAHETTKKPGQMNIAHFMDKPTAKQWLIEADRLQIQ